MIRNCNEVCWHAFKDNVILDQWLITVKLCELLATVAYIVAKKPIQTNKREHLKNTSLLFHLPKCAPKIIYSLNKNIVFRKVNGGQFWLTNGNPIMADTGKQNQVHLIDMILVHLIDIFPLCTIITSRELACADTLVRAFLCSVHEHNYHINYHIIQRKWGEKEENTKEHEWEKGKRQRE